MISEIQSGAKNLPWANFRPLEHKKGRKPSCSCGKFEVVENAHFFSNIRQLFVINYKIYTTNLS